MSEVIGAEAERRFREFYRQTYAEVVRFAARRVEADLAEDVIADAYLVVWRRWSEVPAEADAARAWLFGVVRGVLLNHRRGAGRRAALRVRLAAVPESSIDEPGMVAAQVDLVRAWDRLRETYQEALALAVLDGLTSGQAAAVLGISPVAFRLRLSKARRALRAYLGLHDATVVATSSLTDRIAPNGADS